MYCETVLQLLHNPSSSELSFLKAVSIGISGPKGYVFKRFWSETLKGYRLSPFWPEQFKVCISLLLDIG